MSTTITHTDPKELKSLVDKFAGARHSSSDTADIQMLHDISVRQGATCGSDTPDEEAPTKEKMKSRQTKVDHYLVENLVSTKTGDPYLWLPYATFTKGDVQHMVTPELAAKFKMPHFKPPIKLGNHDETTPAGGHIVRHELRADGIWVYPELVPNGEKAVADGAYRYHSPEIIWEDGYMQDPTSGELIPGPFIMGDALLHTPHLGELTSFYSIERTKNMPDNITEIPTPMFDAFQAWLKKTISPESESPEVTQLKAQASTAEKYKAELDTMKAQAEKQTLLSALVIELQKPDEYKTEFSDAKVAMTAAEHFSAMPEPTRDWTKQQLRALIAQVDETELLKKFGKGERNAGGGTATEKFHVEVMRVATEKKVPYQDAVALAAKEKPDLYQAYINER